MGAKKTTNPVPSDPVPPPINRGGAVVVAIFSGQWQVLAVRAKDGQDWVLPKGHIEEGETSLKAAIRECKEETGVTAVNNEYSFTNEDAPSLGTTTYTIEATGEVVTTEWWRLYGKSVHLPGERIAEFIPIGQLTFADQRIVATASTWL